MTSYTIHDLSQHLQDKHKVYKMWYIADLFTIGESLNDCKKCCSSVLYPSRERAEMHLMSHANLREVFMPEDLTYHDKECPASRVPPYESMRELLGCWIAEVYTERRADGMPVPIKQYSDWPLSIHERRLKYDRLRYQLQRGANQCRSMPYKGLGTYCTPVQIYKSDLFPVTSVSPLNTTSGLKIQERVS